MTIYKRTIAKLHEEKGLKEYDTINLDCANYYLNYRSSILKHNEVPTLTTNCNVAVVVRE